MMCKAMSGLIEGKWKLDCEKIETWDLEKWKNDSVLLFEVFEGTAKLLLVPFQSARDDFNN